MWSTNFLAPINSVVRQKLRCLDIDVYRPIVPKPHHVGDAMRVAAVGFVLGATIGIAARAASRCKPFPDCFNESA